MELGQEAYPCRQSQGSVEHIAQGCNQAGYEYLQGQKLHSLSGQPLSLCDHSQRKKKKVFKLKQKILYFNLCPFALVLSRGTTKKSSAPFSLHTPPCISTQLIRFSLAQSFLRLNSPSSFVLSLYDRCCKSCIFFLAFCHYSASDSLLCWEAKHWTQSSRCTSPKQSRKEGSPSTCRNSNLDIFTSYENIKSFRSISHELLTGLTVLWPSL